MKRNDVKPIAKKIKRWLANYMGAQPELVARALLRPRQSTKRPA